RALQGEEYTVQPVNLKVLAEKPAILLGVFAWGHEEGNQRELAMQRFSVEQPPKGIRVSGPATGRILDDLVVVALFMSFVERREAITRPRIVSKHKSRAIERSSLVFFHKSPTS